MCSNPSNTTACGCCGGGGNGGAAIWSSTLKQQQNKRLRVPKRGPGVAELEKILREQEITTTPRNIKGKGNIGNQFLIPHHPKPHNFSSPPLKSQYSLPPPQQTSPAPASSNLPPHVLPVARFDHLVSIAPPTMVAIYGNGGSSGRIIRNSAGSEQDQLIHGKSMPNLNERVYIGSQSDHYANSPPRNQSNTVWQYCARRNNHHPPPAAMNQFVVTGTRSSPGSVPIGLKNHLEPPSNQSSYYNYTPRAQEEHVMVVGLKRPHSSPSDNSLIPPSNLQAPPGFSHCNIPHQSSVNDSNGAGDFHSTECCYSAKKEQTLELSNRSRFNSDTAMPRHANIPPFATPEVTPPPMHLLQGAHSKGKNVLPCQVTEDKMEDSYQKPESRALDHKSFYNFLQVKGPGDARETAHGSNDGGRDEESGGLDLNLKL